MEGIGSFLIALIVLSFIMFTGDPDLWDKLFELAPLGLHGHPGGR